MKFPNKDTNDYLDYSFDWSTWLKGITGTDTDTIISSVWLVDKTTLTLTTSTFTTTASTIWLSLGVTGETYLVTNRITTFKGRIKDKTFEITIKDN